jgi:hypothetical protein
MVDRRQFLHGVGVALTLPWLESWSPKAVPTGAASSTQPKRLVCFGVDLGMYAGAWIPKEAGKKYTLPTYFEPLKDFRNEFTILSGSDHPGVTGGHRGVPAFLSGVYDPIKIGSAEVLRNSVTIDQFVANRIGTTNRFESLQVSATNIVPPHLMSWNEKGVSLQPSGDTRAIFKRLFVNDPDPKRAEQAFLSGKSVLDTVMADAKNMSKELSLDDHGRLEEYLSGIRDVEKRIERQRQWVNTPKPTAEVSEEKTTTYHENLDVILELTALALQTDSTRVISVQLTESGLPIEVGNIRVGGYHAQSHHGQDPKTLAELMAIETEHMNCLATFMKRLKATKEKDSNLLNQTQILMGAGMGNASSHSNRSLPIMLAGGGLKHGSHIIAKKDTPLCNLFTTILHGMNISSEKFSNSNGNYDSELLA